MHKALYKQNFLEYSFQIKKDLKLSIDSFTKIIDIRYYPLWTTARELS